MKVLLGIDGLFRKCVPSQWLDRVSGYDVFVSYSQRDGAKYAESIAANARREGLTVFRDNDGIRDGEDIPERIVRALNRAKLLLVVATPGAVSSKEVHKERELYLKRKTWLRSDRPISVVYPGNDVSIDLEGIKAISTDGTVVGVTEKTLAAIRDQVGWATSLRRLYSGLLTTTLAIIAAIVLLGWSLSVSKTETVAQKWEAVAHAAEKDQRYSEAESAYRNGSGYAARLSDDVKRVSTFRHLIPFSRVSKPPQSKCRLATLLADGRLLVVYKTTESFKVSIQIDGQEVAELDTESESDVECDLIEREDDKWTLGISNGERLWIVQSDDSGSSKSELAFGKSHHCFCVSADGILKVLTMDDSAATVHRIKADGEIVSESFRPGRNLVSERESHTTKTIVLCGTFSSTGSRDAYVAVAAYPQSDPERACQIDVFELGPNENDFALVASLPLQSITSANALGVGTMAEPYDEPLTGEGRVDFATGLSVSTNENAVAFQFVQGQNFMVGKPFHVVMPAEDFSQNASRTWQESHESARRRLYLGTSAVDAILLVDHPFPAAVVHQNDLARFIKLEQSPSVVASLTTDAQHCELASLLDNQTPVLMNSTSKTLEAFKADHRVRYALPDLDLSDGELAIHAGRTSLIVVESPDSLFCFKRWVEFGSSASEDSLFDLDGTGYIVDVDGRVTIPSFKEP